MVGKTVIEKTIVPTVPDQVTFSGFWDKVQEAGIIQELRERQHYVKPSEIRKKAKAAGRARWLKKQRKLNDL